MALRVAARSARPSTSAPVKRAGKRVSGACPRAASAAEDGQTANTSEVDWQAMTRYVGSTMLQWGLMCATFLCLDFITTGLPVGMQAPHEAKKPLVGALCALLSIRSRVFNPMNNRRQTWSELQEERRKRIRPEWTPPPSVFAFVWTLIAFLRGASSAIIWETCNQSLFSLPLCVYALHLSIGDAWNAINNAERRLGVAASSMIFVLASAYGVTGCYYTYNPLAGYLLVPLSVWLSIAFVLVVSTWKLNGKPPLVPRKGEQRL